MNIGSFDSPRRPATAGLLVRVARYYLGGRRGLIVLGVLALILGIALNWTWLVAAGIAPFLLSALPCVAMCALGLCASKMMNGSCEMSPSSDAPPNGRAADAFPEERTDASVQKDT